MFEKENYVDDFNEIIDMYLNNPRINEYDKKYFFELKKLDMPIYEKIDLLKEKYDEVFQKSSEEK